MKVKKKSYKNRINSIDTISFDNINIDDLEENQINIDYKNAYAKLVDKLKATVDAINASDYSKKSLGRFKEKIERITDKAERISNK